MVLISMDEKQGEPDQQGGNVLVKDERIQIFEYIISRCMNTWPNRC